jgi:hypothetical protein
VKTVYLVTPDDTRVPAARMVAEDLIDLGYQVASYFTRHRRLTRGVPYDAQLGDEHGAINQSGLRKPLTFTIARETR